MRAALYARFSSDRQREASIEDQFRECERTAKANGLEIVSRYSDAAITAGTAERPGYQRLLAGARAHEYDIIVVEDISRLWRSRAEFGPRSAELEDAGIQLLSSSGDDTRRDGYGLVLGIKSAIAEHQRREIAYRTRRGMEGLARAGKSTGGRCYGYGSPAEAGTVRWLFRERAAGVELRVLVDRLHRDGTLAPRGPRWSYNAVKRILSNPRYAGRAIWGATVSQGGARDSRRTRHVMRPEGPLVTRDIIPLVDKDLWKACNPGSVVV